MTTGAVQDYLTIVVDYETYSGPRCWSLLPSAVRELHGSFRRFVTRNVPVIWKTMIRTDDSLTRQFTKPARILLPCLTAAAAWADYTQIVLNYRTHSGKDCWGRLPVDLQQLHAALILQTSALFSHATSSNSTASSLPNPAPNSSTAAPHTASLPRPWFPPRLRTLCLSRTHRAASRRNSLPRWLESDSDRDGFCRVWIVGR